MVVVTQRTTVAITEPLQLQTLAVAEVAVLKLLILATQAAQALSSSATLDHKHLLAVLSHLLVATQFTHLQVVVH